MEDIAKKLKSGNYHFYRYHTTLKKNSKMGFPTHFPGNLKHWRAGAGEHVETASRKLI